MEVRVTGLRETVSTLGRFAGDIEDLPMEPAGRIVADSATARVPRRTGALASTIRPGHTRNAAKIRAGSDTVTYARPVEEGTRNRPAAHFLAGSLTDNTARITDQVNAAVRRTIQTNRIN